MEKLIAVIRISGILGKTMSVAETFHRMRLRRKYSCVLLRENPENIGMLTKVKDFVAYGPISEEVLLKLITARGKLLGKAKSKIENPEKITQEILAGKNLEELKLKPFFRLHPAIGGIDSKFHFGRKKGVLGNNKEAINKLIERML